MHRLALCLVVLFAAAACRAGDLGAAQPATPEATDIPTATSTPASTPTPTPTPTATAPPAEVVGDLRSQTLGEAVGQSGAPCGFVDVFDFPLDPPDAAQASGGSDFGRFRSRYDGNHTGEDWRLGASSFGEPVYSIGHGQVTYAQPNGWGADKGVVIVQHTFRDGRRILSFYGHLDPPSVALRAGQCVERGQTVGDIGDPRTRPHLHFEIRMHLPDTPGPGYWPVDPRGAGWRPPSATIWHERILALPSVGWGRLSDDQTLRPLGVSDSDLLVASGYEELLLLNRESGGLHQTYSLPESTTALLQDARRALLYVAAGSDGLLALEISGLVSGNEMRPAWQLDIGGAFVTELLPLPDGGVVVATRTKLAGVSDEGQVLWEGEPVDEIIDWWLTNSELILLTRDRVWVIGASGPTWSAAPLGSRGIVAGPRPLVYAVDGLYRLNLELNSSEQVLALPRGFPRRGDLGELPNGRVLIVHPDPFDERLILLDSEGTLVWERSLASIGASSFELLVVGDRAYLITSSGSSSTVRIEILGIDQESGLLTRLLAGGSRSARAPALQVSSAGDLILLGISGVGLYAWAP